MRELWLAFGLALLLPGSAARGDTVPERLTLDECLTRARALNPDVLTAAAEVRRAEGLVIEARASALPVLKPQATYTWQSYSAAFLGYSIVNPNQFNASIPLTVPVIAPPAWARWAHAVDDRHTTELGQEAVARQVAIAVASAYITVMTQRRTVDLEVVSRDNAASHAAYTRQQLDAGNGNRLDAARAAQQLHTAQAQLENAQQGLLKAQEALGVLVAGDIPVDAAAPPTFRVPAPDSDPAQRADIHEQVLRQTAARHVVRDDYVDYLPTLSATLAPIFNLPAYFGVPGHEWQLQLSLAVPLYDGGARYGLARQRRALLDEATNTLDGDLRTMNSDVRYGHEALARATARVQETREASALSHEALKIATLRYREGATTDIEVIDAEQQSRNADLGLAIAEDDELQVRLNLLAAAGGFP
jgi:outer membrane protein